MEDDAALLARAASGDAEAWDAVLERHGAFALGLARQHLRRIGASGIHPEDLVQEIWVRLLRGRVPSLDPERGLRPYLAAAVLNQARMHRRGSARRQAREEGHAGTPLPPEAPDEPLLRAEDGESLRAALARLAPEDRLLLRWIYWEGLGYAAVAGILGCAVDSVGPRVSRVRERLREGFAENTAGGGFRGIVPS